jgi:hypothetical protein
MSLKLWPIVCAIMASASAGARAEFFICDSNSMQGYGFSRDEAVGRLLSGCASVNAGESCRKMKCEAISHGIVYTCRTNGGAAADFFGASSDLSEAKAKALWGCSFNGWERRCDQNLFCSSTTVN